MLRAKHKLPGNIETQCSLPEARSTHSNGNFKMASTSRKDVLAKVYKLIPPLLGTHSSIHRELCTDETYEKFVQTLSIKVFCEQHTAICNDTPDP